MLFNKINKLHLPHLNDLMKMPHKMFLCKTCLCNAQATIDVLLL